MIRPDHDDGVGRLQLAVDRGAEYLARGEVGIPPDRIALGGQKVGKRPGRLRMLLGVADENLARHAPCSACGGGSLACPVASCHGVPNRPRSWGLRKSSSGPSGTMPVGFTCRWLA